MFYFLIMWFFVDVNLSCKTIWVLLFPIFSKPTSAIPVSKKDKIDLLVAGAELSNIRREKDPLNF